jgi:DNA-directed RNA polymerase subunit RPC12/RpoP
MTTIKLDGIDTIGKFLPVESKKCGKCGAKLNVKAMNDKTTVYRCLICRIKVTAFTEKDGSQSCTFEYEGKRGKR